MFWILAFIFLVLIPGIAGFFRWLIGEKPQREKPDFRLELNTENIAGVEHATIHRLDGSMVNLVRVTMKDGTEGTVRTIHGGDGRLIGGEDETVFD